MRYVLLGVFCIYFLMGFIAYAFESKDIKKDMGVEDVGKVKVFLYVYDVTSETWNKATQEDLKNAKCKELRSFNIATEGE